MSTQLINIIGQFLIAVLVVSLLYVSYRYCVVTAVRKENPYDQNRKDSFTKLQMQHLKNKQDASTTIPNTTTHNNMEEFTTTSTTNAEDPFKIYHNGEELSKNSIMQMSTEKTLETLNSIVNDTKLIESLKEDTDNSKVEFLGKDDNEIEDSYEDCENLERPGIVDMPEEKQNLKTKPTRKSKIRKWG